MVKSFMNGTLGKQKSTQRYICSRESLLHELMNTVVSLNIQNNYFFRKILLKNSLLTLRKYFQISSNFQINEQNQCLFIFCSNQTSWQSVILVIFIQMGKYCKCISISTYLMPKKEKKYTAPRYTKDMYNSSFYAKFSSRPAFHDLSEQCAKM